MRALLLVSAAALLTAGVASAATWVVDQGGGGDFTTIQEALDHAASGDIVNVHPGTYHESINYLGKAVSVSSTAGPAATTIDAGPSGGSAVIFAMGEPPAAVLASFTITGGLGADCAEEGGRVGGGVFCDGSSPTLRDCHLVSNRASSGGAVYTRAGSPEIISCVFQDNFSDGYGGAITCSGSSAYIHDCLFEGNVAVTGDGTIHLTIAARIEDCVFRDNEARQGGGVNCAHAAACARIVRCDFLQNRATGVHGGGIRVHEASPVIEDCLFVGNGAREDGGGLIALDGGTPLVARCTFYGNTSGRWGGNLAVWSRSAPEIANCIIVQAEGEGVFCQGGSPSFHCNDCWGNAGGNYVGCPDPTGTQGNISADPLLCDSAGGDFTLHCASPCAPDYNPACGQIGALPVGCGSSPAQTLSWGGLKAVFGR